MSLILTEISSAGIAMAADSAISMRNPQTGQTEAHEKDWLKLLKAQRIMAAVAYWGNIGAVSGQQDFDEWLELRLRSNAYNDLPSLAGFLADELNKATKNKPLPYDQCVGIHVAGYHKWEDGVARPTFYHVHNGHGHIAPNYTLGLAQGQIVVTGMNPEWVAEPRRLFQAHLDYPSPASPLAQNIAGLDGGYITRNGDYFPYLLISDGMNFIRQTLGLAGISLPRDDKKLGPRLGYLSLVMRTVISIYSCSSLTEIIGGHVTALGITPDGRYEGITTRKSKFVALREAHLKKLP
jgi:hypothetical protein